MADTSFASLNPTLLARKGGAKPAMRPQAMAGMGGVMGGNLAADLDDLGWNDMGADDEPVMATVTQLTPAPAPSPTAANEQTEDAPDAKPVVHEQQDEIAEIFAKPAPQKQSAPKQAKHAKGKRAAFTLRLDAERHLRLRLASTVQGRSAQTIVTEALDALLAKIPELETLAGQIQPPKLQHKEVQQEGM